MYKFLEIMMKVQFGMMFYYLMCHKPFSKSLKSSFFTTERCIINVNGLHHFFSWWGDIHFIV